MGAESEVRWSGVRAEWSLTITIHFTGRKWRRKLAGRTEMNHLPFAGRGTIREARNSPEKKQSRVGEDRAANL